MQPTADHSTLTACHECDLLLTESHPAPGQKACCPRCGYTLAQGHKDSVSRGLALCLTGLLLFYPALFLPVLSLNILGQTNAASVYDGIVVLVSGEYLLVAVLVFICTVAIPLTKLLLLSFCLISTYRPYRSTLALQLFRWYHGIRHWGMLEIYLLGILVSVIKLMGMAEIHFGQGFYAFCALMLVTIVLEIKTDEHSIWDLLDKAPRP